MSHFTKPKYCSLCCLSFVSLGFLSAFIFSLQTIKSSALKNTQGKTLSKVMHQSSYDDCMSCDC